MTIETDERTTGIAMLLLYAPFFQQKLIDDRAFRESLALDVNQTIGIDHGAVDFDREKFDAATAALYASGGQATNISDTRHRKWRPRPGMANGGAGAVAAPSGTELPMTRN